MKILYDNEVFIMQRYGGISRYFYEVIRRISKFENNDIILYQGYHINEYPFCKEKSDKLKIIGRKIPFIPKTKYLISKTQNLFFRKYLMKNNFDLFHKTYYKPLPKRKHIKSVVTIHDLTHENYPEYFSKLDNTIENKRKSLNKCEGIICISNSTKNDLLNTYITDESKIRVIYHANSLKITPQENAMFDFPYILYVGDRRGYKNFRNFIKGYANSEKLRKNLQIVCFGGGALSNKELNLFKDLKIDSLVYQTSGDDKKLANIYNFAFMFIYPSFYEGFGIPVLEAMHYGCPVLTSNRSSLPEVGGDAAEYFDPENIDDITSKMESVFENIELRKTLIKKGSEREKLFSWDKCAEETYKFYKEISGK